MQNELSAMHFCENDIQASSVQLHEDALNLVDVSLHSVYLGLMFVVAREGPILVPCSPAQRWYLKGRYDKE